MRGVDTRVVIRSATHLGWGERSEDVSRRCRPYIDADVKSQPVTKLRNLAHARNEN